MHNSPSCSDKPVYIFHVIYESKSSIYLCFCFASQFFAVSLSKALLVKREGGKGKGRSGIENLINKDKKVKEYFTIE